METHIDATPAKLRARAARYRLMLRSISDQRIIDALNSLALEYDALADELSDKQEPI